MKTDTEILMTIIKELDLNPRSFSKKLGYASASTIYNITKGTNKISNALKSNIRLTFPQVNRNYLDKGEGLPILKGPQYTDQQNIENIFPQGEQAKVTTLEDLLALPHNISNISLMAKRNYEGIEKINSDLLEIKELLKNFSQNK